MKQKWQLRDPEWTARKKRYWASHDRVCVKCGFGTEPDEDKILIHLHHVKYGRKRGTERDGELMGLCPPCHSGVHSLASKTGWPVWKATYRYMPGARPKVITISDAFLAFDAEMELGLEWALDGDR